MAAPRLTLYVDVVSPFSYLAVHVVRNSPVFAACDVTFVPALLRGIFTHCGNTAPITVKNKSPWINRERLRWARLFAVPMAEQVPPGWPYSSVAVLRALTALTVIAPEKVGAVLAALYHASFASLQRVSTAEEFLPIFSAVLGKEIADTVAAQCNSEEAKKLLVANTDAAIASGAFGLPWFMATDAAGTTECFWGFDHLAQVAAHLGLERPVGRGGGAGWRAVL
ncbi:Glutathione S-transferase kappa 1 [Xylographa carneopallida]|nr:Glutathione S-transferase kappa 1 [Xylographa carneopallida]